MFYDQSEYEIRQEWGLRGVEVLAPISDVVIVVDVLSFSTCVDVAVGRGAAVYPYRWRDESAGEYAKAVGAILALPHRVAAGGYSLSPTSLMEIPEGTRLVLPSPNGSTLTLAAGETVTLAGCLRNARAVAEAAQRLGERISVIAAGERWPDGSMRAAVEDLVGAGAIIHYLAGKKSPEAVVAEAAFVRVKEELPGWLAQCSSGKELVEKGFMGDVELAAALNVSECVPVLRDGAYVRLAHSPNTQHL
jgi:2-phosphosulfolactate phosphatase